MGVDGHQYLSIRGPKDILDNILETGVKVGDGGELMQSIADRFFGSENITVCHRDDKYLVIKYEYRNSTINNYLELLPLTYPMCWFKNEYSTEDGERGVWIGRMRGRELETQARDWMELTDEEIVHGTF